MRETTNYKLGLWEVEDEVEREGINGNFAALDAALKTEAEARVAGLGEKAAIVTGSYTGSGEGALEIRLGFPPKAVLVVDPLGRMGWTQSQHHIVGGLALPGHPVTEEDSKTTLMEITENGFRVVHLTGQFTANAGKRLYLAVK